MSTAIAPLLEAQRDASDPAAHVWLNASAGTGKTQVLSARVLRLLLDGVDPGAILCITFTKAGAAEMAERVSSRLASWVQIDERALRQQLTDIGVDHRHDPDIIDRARSLFTRVIDAPGGGLAIQTIHSFAQGLLSSFPLEADISPGFRPLEDGEGDALLREALGAQLDAYAAAGRDRPLAAVAALVALRNEGETMALLRDCARVLGPGNRLPSEPGPFVRRGLGLPDGPAEAWMATALVEDIDDDDLRAVIDACAGWRTPTSDKIAAVVTAFRAGDGEARAALADALHGQFITGGGTLRTNFTKETQLGAAEGAAEALAEALGAIRATAMQMRTADLLAGVWAVGQDVADRLARMKVERGVADFDDLIDRAAALVATPGLSDWVRYKLDARIDHVLVDEAQDTNARQWAIIAGVAGEFFAGDGAGAERRRTLFTVGDRKQAIFSFQGTDPEAFERARHYFAEAAAGIDRSFAAIDLDTNFRSSPAVLDVVDAWINRAGPGAMGIAQAIGTHRSGLSDNKQRSGRVELWEALTPPADEPDEDDPDAEAAGEPSGGADGDDPRAAPAMATDSASRRMANALARTVRGWLTDGLDGRPVAAGDIMVLVRSRQDLAALLVARMQAEGVPVAGVDRFALALPLAVQDLIAAGRFAYQPFDDLSLACLLTSPLMGWSQDQLMHLAMLPRAVPLWDHLRAVAKGDPVMERDVGVLNALLNRADFDTPHRFFERILTGPMRGRAKLLARLGASARDPIEELLTQALLFEQRQTPTLGGFLAWVEDSAVTIKRVTDTRQPLVRVMTVHGSKGLEAPIVILANAASATGEARGGFPIDISGPTADGTGTVRGLPVFPMAADARAGVFADAHDAHRRAAVEEHWRLMYVAITRARQLLVVTGSVGARGVKPDSWYSAVDATMEAMGHEWRDDAPAPFGRRRVHAYLPRHWAPTAAQARKDARAPRPEPLRLPDWATTAPAPEARPPRPLSPSSLGRDDVAAPAPLPEVTAASIAAATRGRLMHQLFERLPLTAPDARAEVAAAWLARRAAAFPASERAGMVRDVLAVIDDPAHAALFGPDALAEVPLSAVVDGRVVAGTVDRLLVTETRVELVDFKTGVRVPRGVADVPDAYRRQMAAYAAALRVIFPGRAVTACLLFTGGPVAIRLTEAELGDPFAG